MIDPIELLRDRARRLPSRARDLVSTLADALERPDVGHWKDIGPGVIAVDDALRELGRHVEAAVDHEQHFLHDDSCPICAAHRRILDGVVELKAAYDGGEDSP